jgi:16S rRNA (adenine1518-N6/adenine1519-N6)-dimethyltransferase
MKRPKASRSRGEDAFAPRRSLGQHFLLSGDLLAFLVGLGEVMPTDDLVLEVGPGPGNLTAHLLKTGARVLAVELDPRFSARTPAALGQPPGLRWLAADVLAGKNAWSPRLVETVAEELRGRAHLKLIANLPYSVAVPVLSLLATSPWPITLAVVMVQAEVADRIVATPGSKEYGPISVVLALAGAAKMRRRVGRGSFWPPPKVDSAIVEIRFHAERRASELAAVLATCRRLFPYRRKTLRAALRHGFKGEIEPSVVDSLAIRFGSDKRLETVTPGEFVELWRSLAEAGVAAGE